MLTFRPATKEDVDLLFQWANDVTTRQNSYNRDLIKYEDHIKWFDKLINSSNCYCYIFSDKRKSEIGQVRIEKDELNSATISISVDKDHRGKGYSTEMLQKASIEFIKHNPRCTLVAFIFKENIASFKTFLKAGFKDVKESVIKNIPSYVLFYNKENDERH